jgi:hypothetical protein
MWKKSPLKVQSHFELENKSESQASILLVRMIIKYFMLEFPTANGS